MYQVSLLITVDIIADTKQLSSRTYKSIIADTKNIYSMGTNFIDIRVSY